ncbi:MAG: hypothetical protein Q9222_001621 [Ikaeria aurantiellina]
MLFQLFAYASLALAIPLAQDGGALQERTITQDVTATVGHTQPFDELEPGPIIAANTFPVPENGLNYSSFISQTAGTLGIAQGVVPTSGKIYIANGPLSPNRAPMLSIKGTNTKMFDLKSFYYGCLVANETAQAQLSTSCTFSVSGVKAESGSAVAPVTFKFSPSSLTNAAMHKATFGIAFAGLQSATVKILSSDATICANNKVTVRSRHVKDFAIPVNEPTNITSPYLVSSILAAPGDIDPRFKVVISSRGHESLDTDAGLLAVATMLYRFSAYDYNGLIEPAAYLNSEFPSVKIWMVRGPGANDIPARFAIWGAYLVGQYITQRKIVRDDVFAMTFSGLVFGYIKMKKHEVRLAGAAANKSHEEDRDLHTGSATVLPSISRSKRSAIPPAELTPSILTSLNDGHLSISINLLKAQYFDKWELLANAYTALLVIAVNPAHQQIGSGWAKTSRSYPDSFSSFRPAGAVEYRRAADAWASTAFYVVREGFVNGLRITAKLDGRIVGEGVISR